MSYTKSAATKINDYTHSKGPNTLPAPRPRYGSCRHCRCQLRRNLLTFRLPPPTAAVVAAGGGSGVAVLLGSDEVAANRSYRTHSSMAISLCKVQRYPLVAII